MHLSLHGLVRGHDPEIGCDADTGGQVRYVLDLMRALGQDGRIRKVELLTRKIVDPRVSPAYAEDAEVLGPHATLLRIPCGPKRYIRKELLWPYISEFVDNTLAMIRTRRELPDVLHAHYADAGLAAARLSKVLGIPLIFTGHSLGRFKLANLLARGKKRDRLFETFSFAERFEAEEETIENSSLLVASSRNEEQQQYRLYDHYDPERILVNPPGCDLERFGRKPSSTEAAELKSMLMRFLDDVTKTALIMLARPDPQKNILAAVKIFAQPELREAANLVLFLGQREDIRAADPVQRRLLQDVLYLIDRHDLYGSVAYPKSNSPEMASALFHYAAATRGVLLAPSRHENFGLTLVEAAAAGLPVATSGAGGMADILAICGHGIVIDPHQPEEAARLIHGLLGDSKRWRAFSSSGRKASRAKLTWQGHIDRYIPAVRKAVDRAISPAVVRSRPRPLGTAAHLLVCDIDDTLTGDRAAIRELNSIIASRHDIIFGIATGRSIGTALATLDEWSVMQPQFLITSVGTEIHSYFGRYQKNPAWKRHIQFRWQPERIRQVLAGIRMLHPQEPEAQAEFKISYYCENAGPHTVAAVKSALRQHLLQARVLVSRGRCVDVLPVRASKGHALRFLATQWRFDLNKVFSAGDSGNDLDMLRGSIRGIVVGNHSGELETLREEPTTYFSSLPSAAGVIDGLRHHGLLAAAGS